MEKGPSIAWAAPSFEELQLVVRAIALLVGNPMVVMPNTNPFAAYRSMHVMAAMNQIVRWWLVVEIAGIIAGSVARIVIWIIAGKSSADKYVYFGFSWR
jgi:hypothetical protein